MAGYGGEPQKSNVFGTVVAWWWGSGRDGEGEVEKRWVGPRMVVVMDNEQYNVYRERCGYKNKLMAVVVCSNGGCAVARYGFDLFSDAFGDPFLDIVLSVKIWKTNK
ncbi:hypothetical protein Hanom_Chr05g00429991 [Helianthus anomalus]